MSTYNINIAVNTTQTTRAIRQVEGQLDRLRDLARNVFVGFGAIAMVSEVRRLVDEFGTLQNRLRIVTNSTEELAAVTDELLGVANRTRVSVRSSAELYTRLTLSTKQYGISQKQALEFTESLNQGLILSGATIHEAEAGLIQFTQALSRGVLRGDEFRSVIEQVPVIADVIAKHLRVDRGELQSMAEAGRLTGDVILQAFKNARQELAERFGKTIPTIEQGFEVLRNKVLFFVGALDKTYGITQKANSALTWLGNNLELVGKTAAAAGAAISVYLVKGGIELIIGSLARLGIALALNPITAIATLVISAGAALAVFADDIAVTSDGLVTLENYAVAAFQLISEEVIGLANSIKEYLIPYMGTINQAIELVVSGFKLALEGVAAFVNGAIGYFTGLVRVMRLIFNEISSGIQKAMGSELAKKLQDYMLKAVDKISAHFTDLVGKARALLGEITIAAIEIGKKADLNFELPEIKPPPIAQDTLDWFADFGSRAKNEFMSGFQTDYLGEFSEILLKPFNEVEKRARELSKNNSGLMGTGKSNFDLTKEPYVDRNRIRMDVREEANKIQRETELLKLNREEREKLAAFQKVQDKLNRQFNQAETELLKNTIAQNHAMEQRTQILDDIRGPAEEYVIMERRLGELYRENEISLNQYNKALRESRLQMLEGDNTAMGGLERGILRMQESVGDLSTLIEVGFTSSMEAAGDAIQEFVMTGETNLRSFIASIAAQLAKLAMQQMLLNLVGGIGGFSAFSAPGVGTSGAAAAGSALNSGNLGSVATLPAFATGGDFTVGGSGGTDSKLVAFRATPGEHVSVRTPAQQNKQAPVVTPAPEVKVINVMDPAVIRNYLQSQAGQKLVLNTLGRNVQSANAILAG